MPGETAIDIGALMEEWELRFLATGFEFDDIAEIGIYPILLTPFKRYFSSKRYQREFIAYPVCHWEEIDPVRIEDYSQACFHHFSRQEQKVMRNTKEKYAVVVFPVILSENVDSSALGHIQRYNVSHGRDIEIPIIFDLEIKRAYLRHSNPGAGDPFFDPYRTEIEQLLKA